MRIIDSVSSTRPECHKQFSLNQDRKKIYIKVLLIQQTISTYPCNSTFKLTVCIIFSDRSMLLSHITASDCSEYRTIIAPALLKGRRFEYFPILIRRICVNIQFFQFIYTHASHTRVLIRGSAYINSLISLPTALHHK